MSHITVTTNISRVKTDDKPQVDVYLNDSNHKDDLTTNTQGLNETSRIVNSQNVNLTDESHAHVLDNNLHNQPIITPSLARNDVDKTHLESSNIQRPLVNDVGSTHLQNNDIKSTHLESHDVQRPLVNDVGRTHLESHDVQRPLVNDVERTHLQSNDINRTHLQSNDVQRPLVIESHDVNKPLVNDVKTTHLESNDVQKPLVNDVQKTNITTYDNVETDLNRKDHWRTPNQTNPTNVTEDYHKDATVIPDTTTNLKTDSHHHHHHDHHDHHDKNKKDHSHETNKKDYIVETNKDVYVNDSTKNDHVPDLNKRENVYAGESNKKEDFYVHDVNRKDAFVGDSNKNNNNNNTVLNKDVYVNDGTKRNEVNIEHENFEKRNLNYQPSQSFANDIGTTGLVGNNLGNNLATNVPAPTGINKDADWAGHVPDLNHPTEAEAKELKKNEKKW